MRIIGLDVCKDSVVAWVLESVPKNFRSYFRENKRPKDDPLKLYANHAGVAALLQLRPDCVVMEPTGIHYSWIWAHICAKENITVLWVGHQEAVHYRKQHKLPDKNDRADALALAAYALTHWGNDEFFLQFEAGAIAKMRELWLAIQSLNRVKSPIINRARQQLAREFPEAALKRSEISLSDGLPPLWSWLAERERSLKSHNSYYDKLYSRSIAPAYGITISSFTRKLASMLCDLAVWERELSAEIATMLVSTEFAPYHRTFNRFGIPPKSQALLLSQIYPMSKFESLGRFKRRLGLAKDENSSGDKESMNTGSGSKLCRCQLYLWILDMIAPSHARPKNEIGQKLGEFYDSRKAQFQDNPELWKQKAIENLQASALRELKKQLSANLISLLPKEQAATVASTLDLSMQAIQMSLMAGLTTELKDKAKDRELTLQRLKARWILASTVLPRASNASIQISPFGYVHKRTPLASFSAVLERKALLRALSDRVWKGLFNSLFLFPTLCRTKLSIVVGENPILVSFAYYRIAKSIISYLGLTVNTPCLHF